ncbi:MAG: hypothetical protein U9Q21_03555 [Candidatus Auribacterota bacterium]|nr:hypothetical protein [Candidatus Auribacterota bacterium]
MTADIRAGRQVGLFASYLPPFYPARTRCPSSLLAIRLFLQNYSSIPLPGFSPICIPSLYYIEIPEDKSLEEYLCTKDGCARFTAAAIKEAEDKLNRYNAGLPPEKKEIMDNLNREEKDALSVAVYKRGPEAVKKSLDEQLDIMVDKKGKQKYIHVLGLCCTNCVMQWCVRGVIASLAL